ncbi:UBX domain-containing protein 6 [Gastrophryne carolinensis]
MKKLFQGIKSDIKFKTAGPGHRLNEERNTADIVCKEEPKLPKPPAGQAQIAAASAAIARIESVQGKGKARAKDTVRVQARNFRNIMNLEELIPDRGMQISGSGCSDLSKTAVMPPSDSVSPKDPADKRIDQMARHAYAIVGPACATSIAALASRRLLKQLDSKTRSGYSRRSCSQLIKTSLDINRYMIMAMDDLMKLSARGLVLVVTLRRILWLKQLSADTVSKKHLTGLPYKRRRLFGDHLDDMVKEATGVAKQLETELEPNITPNQKNKPISEKKATSVCNVLFRCPLSGEILKKNEREAHIRKNIELLSSTDPVSASIMKIHTFNKDRDKVKSGVETIAKYLSNIVDNPNEEKYCSIKLSNKVFQEKIACLEGSHEFFEAIGFQKESHTLPGSDVQDEFYVLSSETVGNMDDLQSYRDSLLNGEPIRATLERLPRVFAPSPEASRFDLPDDFYNLTLEEIKREQQLRKEKLERESALRTKAMREREEQREIRKYNYTVIRIRFSDGYILQGIFYAQEKLSTLFDFVCQHLQNDWLPYELIAPCGQKLNDKEMTFFNCGLVPSALLTFHWDANVLADIEAAQGHKAGTALKQEFISTAETLD